MLRSNLGFFRIGVTAVDLKDDGTAPEAKEDWMMAVVRGRRD